MEDEDDSVEIKNEDGIRGRELINKIFSWSLSDVLNENLYSSQVKQIPKTFSSIDHFMNSFKLPLIEETRVDLMSNIKRVSQAPIRVVYSIKGPNFHEPGKDLLYSISFVKPPESESDGSESETETDESIYEPEIGDLIALTDVRPNHMDDLNRPEWPYLITYVCSLGEDIQVLSPKALPLFSLKREEKGVGKDDHMRKMEEGQLVPLPEKRMEDYRMRKLEDGHIFPLDEKGAEKDNHMKELKDEQIIPFDEKGEMEDGHMKKLEDGQIIPLDEKGVDEDYLMKEMEDGHVVPSDEKGVDEGYMKKLEDGQVIPLDEKAVKEDDHMKKSEDEQIILLDEKRVVEDGQMRKVKEGKPLFAVHLTNLTTNIRIWQALNSELQWKNYDIIQQVLANDSPVDESCSLCNNALICGETETNLIETLSKFKLNDSQKAAILCCIAAKECHHQSTVKLIWGPPGTGKTKTVGSLLFALLKMKCRTLTCAPTNIAVLGVAQRLMSLVKDSLEYGNYGLGNIVLFGNKKRMKINGDDYLHNVFLDSRVSSLSSCFGSKTGWKPSLEFMAHLLEDSEGLYNLYLKLQKEERLRIKQEEERLRKKQARERSWKKQEESPRKEEEEDRRRNSRNSVAYDDQKNVKPKKGNDFSLKLEKLWLTQEENNQSRIERNNKVEDFQYQEDGHSEKGDSMEIIMDESDDEYTKRIKQGVVRNFIDIVKDTKKEKGEKKKEKAEKKNAEKKEEKKSKSGKVEKNVHSHREGKYNDRRNEENSGEVEEGKDEDLTFEEFVTEGFNVFRLGLISCIPILCTHLPTSFISLEVAKEMLKVLFLLNAEDAINGMKYFNTLRVRDECLPILKNLHNTFSIPDFGMDGIKEFCLKNSCLVFCTASSSVHMHTKRMKPVELLVIDEAALLKECESAIPLQLPGLRHAILVGDEKQLSAMVQSKICEYAKFGRSLFERLAILGHRKHLLNVQYRMHPSISLFPNKQFYDNKILDGPNVKERSFERRFLNGGMYGTFSFIDISHGKEEFDNKISTRNMMEVAVIANIIERLFRECVSKNQKVSVGCISPYKAQVLAIQQKLRKKYERASNFSVSVRSVDGFQGMEEDIIIISTVRCNWNGSVGFLSNHNRTNVALTRARYCLWMVGSGSTLTKSRSVWKELVLDAKARGCFYKANEDRNLAQAIVDALTESCQLDSIFSMDSLLFKELKWKVCFNDELLRSIARTRDVEIHRKVVKLLVKLSSSWRLPQENGIVDDKEIDDTASQLLEIYSVDRNLYLLWTVDIIMENSICIQVIKVWYIAPFPKIKELAKNLGRVFGNYTVDRMNRCKIGNVEENLVVPMKWPMSPDDTDTSWRSLSSFPNEPRSFGTSFRNKNWKSNKYGGNSFETRKGGW